MNIRASRLATSVFAFSVLALAASVAHAQAQPIIGLITKTETNPFFVKMKEGAVEAGKAKGAKVLSGAGKADGDNAGQVTAMENMIAAGAKTILITPSDSKAIIPAIKKAQAKGVMIIALDSPTDPAEATDALFATDNYKAGVLIGQYAKAALGGKAPVIATLDLFPGHPVGAQRHNGFMKGFGLPANDQSRLRVGPTLQSIADPAVFAVGDCSVMEGAARPAAGVFGVRAAPVLLQNLAALGSGAPMERYRPQRHWLSIMDLGDGTGLAMRGGLWWMGRGALALKR
eukprot:gene39647-52294_t